MRSSESWKYMTPRAAVPSVLHRLQHNEICLRARDHPAVHARKRRVPDRQSRQGRRPKRDEPSRSRKCAEAARKTGTATTNRQGIFEDDSEEGLNMADDQGVANGERR